jgi:FkbM family methyltransferase
LNELAKKIEFKNESKILKYFAKSKAQNLQDLLVLDLLDFKREGFFVEFGATDGMLNSNSHLLEFHFGWSGILAEPNPAWHGDLRENRRVSISHECVYSKTGERVQFDISSNHELSSIRNLRDNSHRSDAKVIESIYVDTISLPDLLTKYNAPKSIDFISIDTEGSELEIISTFDFHMYEVKIFAIEHNFSEHRSAIRKVMTSNGYIFLEEYSLFQDDFYLLKN